MNQNATSFRKAQRRLCQLHLLFEQIKDGTRKASRRQLDALLKQIRRAARKLADLTSGVHPAIKAGSVFTLSVLLAGNTEAQQCNKFQDANAVNPITINHLPGGREPYFVDIDGDGDLDCYVLDRIYNYDAPFFLKNIGTKELPVYKSTPAESGFPQGTNALSFASTNVAFVDIDGDGDYDCFLAESYSGNFNVHIKYFENQGTPTAPHFVENEAKNPLSRSNGSYFITFSFADIDGDGDLDVHIDTDFFAYDLINTGSKTNPQFNGYANSARGAWYADRVYYDWNNDGLLDYFDDVNGTHYYKNIGPKNNPQYVQDDADGPNLLGRMPHVFTDLNNDGKPEFFDKGRSFATLAPVPLVDTATVNYNGTNVIRFSLSPVGASYSYQAFRNGVPVPNSNHPFFVARTNGIYSFTVTDSCGTGFSIPYRVTYDSASANTMATAKTALLPVAGASIKASAYPNPFTESITLQLPATLSSGTVQVMDLQGKKLLSQRINGSHVSVGQELAKGVYLLQIVQNTSIVYSQKIVKE